MITRRSILANLKTLDRKFSLATTPKESLFYSKLALLELCGWIEESMDDIVLRCACRHLANTNNITFVETQIIKKTHGFDYENNFRQMLIKLLGIINVESIEKRLDQNKLAKFRATLDGLKKTRDPEAHTHIKGVTRSINAPSITLAQFPALYDGLLEFQKGLASIKF